VREAASQLGGEVTADRRGCGHDHPITVPLSLASQQAMIVEAGGHVAAIPLSAIRDRAHHASSSCGPRTARDAVDDLTIAFDSLARLLAVDELAPGTHPVIVGAGGSLAAIAVDQLRGVRRSWSARCPTRDSIRSARVMLDDEGRLAPCSTRHDVAAASDRVYRPRSSHDHPRSSWSTPCESFLGELAVSDGHSQRLEDALPSMRVSASRRPRGSARSVVELLGR